MEPSTSAKAPEQQEEQEQQLGSYPGKVDYYITVVAFINKLSRSLYMVEQQRGRR